MLTVLHPVSHFPSYPTQRFLLCFLPPPSSATSGFHRTFLTSLILSIQKLPFSAAPSPSFEILSQASPQISWLKFLRRLFTALGCFLGQGQGKLSFYASVNLFRETKLSPVGVGQFSQTLAATGLKVTGTQLSCIRLYHPQVAKRSCESLTETERRTRLSPSEPADLSTSSQADCEVPHVTPGGTLRKCVSNQNFQLTPDNGK